MIIVNQSAGYLCIDMANVMSGELNEPITLLCNDKNRNVTKRLNDRIKVKSVIKYDKSSIVRRVYTWIIATIQIWWILLWCNKKERVLFVSNPPFTIFIPLFVHNKASLLIYDIYPDVLVSTGVFKNSTFLVRWWKEINIKVYAKAENVYTITDEMADSLSQYIGKEKITVVPCWPDTNNLEYIHKEENVFIKKHHLEDKFVIMYSGNLGLTHRMDILVDLADRMRNYPIEFIIMGEGGKKNEIWQKIKKLNTPNVRLMTYQPYEMLSHSLSTADIAVVTLDPESANVSIPSKTYNLMNLGRPIMAITSRDAALAKLISKYDIGETFDPGDLQGMEQWILKMMHDKELRERLSRNSKRASTDFTVDNAKMFCKNL